MSEEGKIALLNLAWEPEYKSSYEEAWMEYGVHTLEEVLGSECIWSAYEPVKFVLGKPIYTPDFIHVMRNGQLVIMEIKASRKQRGYRSSRTKLRTAAGIYPFFIWGLGVGHKENKKISNWEIEFISDNMKGNGNV